MVEQLDLTCDYVSVTLVLVLWQTSPQTVDSSSFFSELDAQLLDGSVSFFEDGFHLVYKLWAGELGSHVVDALSSASFVDGAFMTRRTNRQLVVPHEGPLHTGAAVPTQEGHMWA